MPFRPGPRKAEKDENGETIYPCLWIGCSKTFGTAGHVRRHEKSHVGNTPYACPYCDKSFGRSDVRAKHVGTMHADQEAMADDDERPSKRRMSVESSVDRRMSMDSTIDRRPTMMAAGVSPSSANGIASTSPATTANVHSFSAFPAPSLSPHGLWTTGAVSTSPVQPMHNHSEPVTHLTPMSGTANLSSPNVHIPGPVGMMLPPSANATGTPFSVASSSSSGFIDPARLSVGPSSGMHMNLDHASSLADSLPLHAASTELLGAFDPSWEWFGHVFGWGSDENIDLDIGLQSSMFEKNGIGPVSSTDTLSAAWLLCATPRGGSPVGDEGPNKGTKVIGMLDPFGRKDESPWPSVFKPKLPDRPLSLAGVRASPRAHRPRSSPEAVSETSRNAMLSLIYLSHQPHWLMPDVDDFPDHETLSDFVDLYFEKFHPLFPIVHKPSFWTSETPAVLLLSVAAIGATYADQEFRPLAVALCELVRRMIAWMRGSDQRAKFDRNALTAFMLQTALGVACGSREMFYHAEIFRCSIVTTCRRLHLLRGLDSATDELYAKDPDPPVEARYKAYLEDESRRRLGWGVYLLDSQMAALLHIPAIFAVNEAAIHPPTEEILWEASDAESWASLVKEGAAIDPKLPRPKFLKLLKLCLAGERDYATQMSDLTCAVVSYTVWRMLMDQHLLQRALGVGLSDNGMDLAAYNIEAHVLESKPAHLLLRLAQATFPHPTPSQLRLSPAALYHHAHLQFTRPGLMERIKHVSGKYEPDMTMGGSMSWLGTWMEDGREVRKVLWHAGVLSALLAEFPRGSFAELFWMFDCALVFWAINKYASHQLHSKTFQSALFAANWFDTSPPDMWLAHGGQMVFPFLGSSSSWTVCSLLEVFMDKLDEMPWGLAVQYKLVLNRLLEREKEDMDGIGKENGES
ncbi:hypothetical protein IAR55_002900 [Kwoniella newhampshirensis]|uniref:C2H2-type domain-containing protein n=1 Tax=Kwoniella newhampshirensis TaxID=1651941 RepID=A0AAW0YPA3_9TREE